ncbi:MAG: class II aldolase/adducin family protein [Ignavibacteria bacterium]|nr:class II aldolase/adducin family protein [Ignavibacteria bacterium]
MSLRKELTEFCHKVYEKGFVSAYDGNLSCRIDAKRILITPSGKCKGEIIENDLLEIDYEGNLLYGEGKVSTEAKIHLLAYNKRSDINSVFHCHPIYSTAFAAIGESLSRPIFPEVVIALGKVPLCKYGTPSTNEVTDSILPYIDYSWALLLENHGAVTFGKTIKGAYFRMEKLEHAAHTIYIARTLGREKAIPLNKLKQLYAIAEDVYNVKIDERNRMD